MLSHTLRDDLRCSFTEARELVDVGQVEVGFLRQKGSAL